MDKTVEILLIALVLSGMYCAIPRNTATGNSASRNERP